MVNLTRYYMYKKIRGYFKESIKGNILGISGIENFYFLIEKENSELTEVEYPEVDMQDLPYEDNSFDFVISDQVIEHLKNPQKAIKESYRVLKKDGIAIHTTCFINYIHYGPKDFWRFSPDALKYLCKDFSEILQCEGWGNRIAILFCLLSDRLRLMAIPASKWSIRNLISTYNEYRYPIVVWVIAIK